MKLEVVARNNQQVLKLTIQQGRGIRYLPMDEAVLLWKALGDGIEMITGAPPDHHPVLVGDKK